ncbi:MAG: hypothetical protein ACI83B_002321 [Sediminicola sp.]|jgi:hypothetical protein
MLCRVLKIIKLLSLDYKKPHVIFFLQFTFLFSIQSHASIPKVDFKKWTFEKSSFEYLGAFRISLNDFGDSRMGFAQGTFTISAERNSFFIVGHTDHQAIAEFPIPQIKNEKSLKKLSMASTPIQPFYKVLNRGNTGNPENINRITGLEIIDSELFINGIDFYDAPADNHDTTLILRDPKNLKSSKVHGFFKLQGRAHSAGWISKIPPPWDKRLDASYIFGHASNYSINSRLSIGPTAFVYYLENFANIDERGGLIPATPLLDFSLNHPLHPDLYNKKGQNDLWTEVSSAMYGFIIPNSDKYLIIGNSGGHESGIGYKIKQTNGNLCGGPCPKNHNDEQNQYWLWDMNDLNDVKKQKTKPYMPKPTAYGKIQLPFQPKATSRKIIGADFDEKNNLLYILIEGVDKLQSKYEAAPLMTVYKYTGEVNG